MVLCGRDELPNAEYGVGIESPPAWRRLFGLSEKYLCIESASSSVRSACGFSPAAW